jgi:citrate synthase
MMLQTRVNSGLDGVIVADTVMSEVDGEAGRLIVRGHAIEELVATRGFEGVAALLWDGFAPSDQGGGGDERAVRDGLASARVRAFAEVPRLLQVARGLTPVEGLRVGLGMLADSELMPHHYLVCGALPVFLAALLRASESKSALAPDPALTTAQDLLRMIRGRRADTVFERALDAYLATITDHGFNASTFTARVVASTHAGLISSVLAGLCALKGPLHGGAPGPVLDMFDEIGTPERADAWFDDAFSKGTTLMGFGHRIYKVRDPRADVLKNTVATLPQTAGRLAFAVEVEKSAIAALRRHKPGRRLDTNVEYYTALLLEALEVPRSAFTALFAVGRAAGWCAHIFEQEKGGRIIRPQSNYVGPRP